MTTTTKAAKPSAKPKTPFLEPKPSAPGLIIHRLELTPESKAQVIAVSDHFGMTQIAALSRLGQWFATQPPEIQTDILNGRTDAARQILARMAAGRP